MTGRQIPVPTNTSPRAVLVLLILIQQQKSNFRIAVLIQLIRDRLIHHQLLNGLSGAPTQYAVSAVAMELNHDHVHVLMKVNVRDHLLSRLLAMKVLVLVARSISVIGVLILPKNAIPLLHMTILGRSLFHQKANVL